MEELKAAKTKEKEKETPTKCVCGKAACMVKAKSKYMYTCPDTMHCPMRSRWLSSEQLACKDWNACVLAERHRRKAGCDKHV